MLKIIDMHALIKLLPTIIIIIINGNSLFLGKQKGRAFYQKKKKGKGLRPSPRSEMGTVKKKEEDAIAVASSSQNRKRNSI